MSTPKYSSLRPSLALARDAIEPGDGAPAAPRTIALDMTPDRNSAGNASSSTPVAVSSAGSLDPAMNAVAARLAAALAQRCDASTDEQAIEGWLGTHAAGSAQTRRAYAREARRLLAWLIWQKGPDDQLLPLVTLPDATAFVHWLMAPGGSLIPEGALARAGLPDTQPVSAGLSKSSLNQAVVILNGLYLHLNTLQAPWGPYAPFNPFRAPKAAVRKGIMLEPDGTPSAKKGPARPTARPGGPLGKALSKELWNEVLATIEMMPRETPAEEGLYWQTWWVVRLQYHSVLRRFESVKALMSDVVRTDIGYELHVVGKGNKAAEILMSDVFVRDMKTYRTALGMSPMPVNRETGPLIAHASPTMRAAGAHISEATLYRRVTGVFEKTADRLRDQGAPWDEIQRLRDATLHGVRHTGITHLLDAGVPMRTTSRLARHASMATTAVYDSQDKRQQLADINTGATKLQQGRDAADAAAPQGVAGPQGAADTPGPGDRERP